MRRDGERPGYLLTVTQGKKNGCTVDDNVPIHRHRIWMRRDREKREHEHEDQDDLRSNVDRRPEPPQAKLRRGQRITSNPTPGHTADRDDVAGQKRVGGQRRDGVQGGGRADVDE